MSNNSLRDVRVVSLAASRVEDHGRGGLRRAANAWVPVAACILAIALESTSYFGVDHTSGPLRRFCEFLFGPYTQPQWWRTHILIRKWGHFTGYGILSLAWFRAFWMMWRTWRPAVQRQWSAHGLAMLGTLAVASADELHQLFLPNRTGSGWDVALDGCGGLVMQLIVGLWMERRLRRPESA